jgi:hypothetical protein
MCSSKKKKVMCAVCISREASTMTSPEAECYIVHGGGDFWSPSSMIQGTFRMGRASPHVRWIDGAGARGRLIRVSCWVVVAPARHVVVLRTACCQRRWTRSRMQIKLARPEPGTPNIACIGGTLSFVWARFLSVGTHGSFFLLALILKDLHDCATCTGVQFEVLPS